VNALGPRVFVDRRQFGLRAVGFRIRTDRFSEKRPWEPLLPSTEGSAAIMRLSLPVQEFHRGLLMAS
jgi:hypothetical protein